MRYNQHSVDPGKDEKKSWGYVLKGPKDGSGKPETEIAKLTPVPFALEVPATKPRRSEVVLLGKKAV